LRGSSEIGREGLIKLTADAQRDRYREKTVRILAEKEVFCIGRLLGKRFRLRTKREPFQEYRPSS